MSAEPIPQADGYTPRRLKIYIAGPMRGLPFFNFPAFDEAAEHLRGAGYEVLSPAEHDRANGLRALAYPTGDILAALNDGFDLDAAFSWDIEQIRYHADAVAVLPGWGKSKGALVELALANLRSLPVWDAITLAPLSPNMAGEEVRVTNHLTGGEKGAKPARFSLIPPSPMNEVARVYGYGARKYAPRNWEKGYDWSLSQDALLRHINAFARLEDRDPESGLHHLAHAVFHCLALMEWGFTHPELDDRSSGGKQQ